MFIIELKFNTSVSDSINDSINSEAMWLPSC